MTSRRISLGLFVCALFVSTCAVALAFTPVPHTGGDNAGYISLAHGLLTTGSYTDVFDPAQLPHTKYPPVFSALLAMLIAMGARTWVALKMTAAVPTVLAVGLTYLWAERSVGALAAFGIAALLGVSSGIVYYSHWVLSDPLFLMLTMGGVFALSRADGVGGDATGTTDAVGTDRPGGAERALDSGGPEARRHLWLAAGVVLAGLAYFTRSAGLPLVVALLAWLVLRRRWRALGAAGVGLGLPMALWWLRGRGAGVAQYSTEFWMVNPYEPALGTIGVTGLIPRVLENLGSYVLQHGPVGILGSGAPALPLLGIVLTLVAVTGWVMAARRRVGVVELFFPMYAGLILLWPSVWGGDRFALPLYPILFFYAALALRTALARLPDAGRIAGGAFVALTLILPAAGNVVETSGQAAACGPTARDRGVWACYSAPIQYFIQASSWSGPGLPDGAAAFSRKPRHFYLQSGHPSRAFPFVEDVEVHLALADELGVRYVLLDRWDGLASRYVGAAVTRRPGAYCYIGAFGQPQEGGVQLFGILPPEQRVALTGSTEGDVGVSACPDGYAREGATAAYSSSGRIPLLEGLDP